MAFFGAIIAGFITLAICAWRYGYNPGSRSTAVLSSPWSGKPIGRIGNVINGDILGAPSNPSLGNAVLESTRDPADRVQPLHPGAVHRIISRLRCYEASGHPSALRLIPVAAVSPECRPGRGLRSRTLPCMRSAS